MLRSVCVCVCVCVRACVRACVNIYIYIYKFYSKEITYSMFKDELQNCSLNQTE